MSLTTGRPIARTVNRFLVASAFDFGPDRRLIGDNDLIGTIWRAEVGVRSIVYVDYFYCVSAFGGKGSVGVGLFDGFPIAFIVD